MGINLKEVFVKWNEEEIVKYERLLHITNKSILMNKHKKKLKQHIEARHDIKGLMNLVAEDSQYESSKELKKLGLIKRIK